MEELENQLQMPKKNGNTKPGATQRRGGILLFFYKIVLRRIYIYILSHSPQIIYSSRESNYIPRVVNF